MRNLVINFYPDSKNISRKKMRLLPGYTGSCCPELGGKTMLTPINPPSYISGSDFSVSVVYGVSGQWKGYQVEIYPGDCSVSCELLTHNNPMAAAQLALSLLQEWLIFWDTPLDLVKLFSVAGSKIRRATAALFVPFDSIEEVRTAVSTLADRAELLQNQKISWATDYQDRLQFHGSRRNGYWELSLQDHSIRFFALNDPAHWMSRVAYSHDIVVIPAEYLALCQRYLFIEVTVKKRWLTRNAKVSPADWGWDEVLINDEILSMVEHDFGLRQNFPIMMPTDAAVKGLGTRGKNLMAWYFDGSDPRHHKMFVGQKKPHDVFAENCDEIKSITGIDLTVPFTNVQQLAAHQKLERFLTPSTDFDLPPDFEQYVFASPEMTVGTKSPEVLFAEHQLDQFEG